MCNFLHYENTPCKEEGIAWKIFNKNNSSLISFITYKTNKNGWIKWNTSLNSREGFCMFRTRDEARRALKNWKIITKQKSGKIKKVEYKKGLGVFMEEHFIHPQRYEILIAKAFKIIEE